MSKSKKIPFAVAGKLREAINRFKAPQNMASIAMWMGLAEKLDSIVIEGEIKREQALASVGVKAGEVVTQADPRFKEAVAAMQKAEGDESLVPASEIAIYTEAELWREAENNLPIADAVLVMQWLKREGD